MKKGERNRIQHGRRKFDETTQEKDEKASKILYDNTDLFAGMGDYLNTFGCGYYDGEPCIHVVVKPGMGKKVEGKIPDNIKGVHIYYTEGEETAFLE